MAYNEREREFEIVKHIGVIADHPTGWKKELNIVRWNGGISKYDIRDWNKDHSRMSRGLTLWEEEAKIVAELILKEAD